LRRYRLPRRGLDNTVLLGAQEGHNRNLSRYARALFQLPSIAGTVNFEHIRKHYHTSHKAINPNGIVPIGPELDFSAGVGK
jgi:glutathionyl-hydroquinone reductase